VVFFFLIGFDILEGCFLVITFGVGFGGGGSFQFLTIIFEVLGGDFG
jgi:hypothetical protein